MRDIDKTRGRRLHCHTDVTMKITPSVVSLKLKQDESVIFLSESEYAFAVGLLFDKILKLVLYVIDNLFTFFDIFLAVAVLHPALAFFHILLALVKCFLHLGVVDKILRLVLKILNRVFQIIGIHNFYILIRTRRARHVKLHYILLINKPDMILGHRRT